MSREITFTELRSGVTVEEACADWAMDEESFRAFYERTARGLWAYLYRVTSDRQLADDLLQDTFYRFLKARGSYESEAHRRNSLYRTATNLVRDHRRRRRTREPYDIAGHDIERVPSGQDAAAAERASDVTRALSRLKPRERAMLWLAYAEGASHTEIAGALGLRVASLKPLLYRVRRKLAALLSGKEDGRS